MSRESVALHQRALEILNTRELSDEVAEELLAPDFCIVNGSTAVTDKTYHGPEGVREWIRDMFEAFDDAARLEIEEVLADGDDFAVAMVRLAGSGARSGAPLALRWPTVMWCRNGKMTREVGYLRRREALEAVGLMG